MLQLQRIEKQGHNNVPYLPFPVPLIPSCSFKRVWPRIITVFKRGQQRCPVQLKPPQVGKHQTIVLNYRPLCNTEMIHEMKINTFNNVLQCEGKGHGKHAGIRGYQMLFKLTTVDFFSLSGSTRQSDILMNARIKGFTALYQYDQCYILHLSR